MTWSNRTKNTSSATNQTKNTSTSTNYLRHGKEPTMAQLADYTLLSVVFMDGTILESVTFAELADAVWSNRSKS